MTIASPADQVVQPWRDFPVGQTPRPIVFLDSPVHIGDEGFIDGNAKLSWLAGAIETTAALPEGILSLLTNRQRRRAAPATLTITAVERCDEEFWCDRGPRRLPAYRLDITGLRQPVIVIDPTLDCWWPDHNALDQARGAGDHATIHDDGLTIDFPAFGGVLTTFHRAEFLEYATCVVGHAVTSQQEVPPGTAVPAVGIGSAVTGHLNAPLGGRVLLHTNGEPLAVLAAAGTV